jgi:hypothetical protein
MQLGGSCATDVNVHEDHPAEHVYAPPPPVVREDVHVYREAPPPPVVHEDVRVYEEAPVVREDVHIYDEDRGTHHDAHRYLPAGIPRGSELVKDEHGKIRWTADDNGTFYLYDVNKDFVRYSGPVHRGQEVIVMPGDDIIYVDQRAVSHENLQHDNRHRIYFAHGLHDTQTEEYRGEGHKTGGAGDPGRTIPKGAARLSTSKGDLVINAAKRAGTVFLYDEDNRNVIYTADIDHGNSFKYSADKGFIYVNSKRIAAVKVPQGHTLSLYFGEH